MARKRIGFRGKPAASVGFGSTEGEGMYVARTRQLAEFFAGEEGTVEMVEYEVPANPLIVNDEPLLLLEESGVLYEPMSRKDSEWVRLNKMAALQAKQYGVDDDETFDPDVIARELTKLIKGRGYDAVEVTSGGDTWDVLFSPKIVRKVRV